MFLVYAIILLWIAVAFIDLTFKSCLFHGYISLLGSVGLSIKPFHLTWYVTRYNHVWNRIGHRCSRFIDQWFYVGFLFTLLVIPIAVGLLFQTLASFIFARDGTSEVQALQPVLPGVNIPLKDLGYYVGALIIASAFHEAGHALAAARANLRIHGFGLYVFGVVPAAFVELPTEGFANLSARNRLKIVCAGVWHNFVLAAFCAAILFANPYILSPIYSPVDGVVVAKIDHAGISKPGGLKIGDVIMAVDNCPVLDKLTWKGCLSHVVRNPQKGYCAPKKFVEEEQLHSLEPGKCCGDDNPKNLCFQTQNVLHGVEKLCLPARLLLQSYRGLCNQSSDCQGYSCLKPLADDPFTKLFTIKRQDQDDFLFWGFPGEIFEALVVVGFKSNLSLVPVVLLHYQETFLRYIISFSLALGVLNAVPCFYLDGHWIVQAVVEILLQRYLSVQKQQLVANCTTLGGTFLVASSIVLAIYQLIAGLK